MATVLSVLESFTPTGTTLLSTRGHNERGVKRGNDKRREMKSAWKGAANVHGDNYARSNAMYPPETVAIHWRKLDYPTAFKKLKRIVELEYNFVYGYYSMRKEKKKKRQMNIIPNAWIFKQGRLWLALKFREKFLWIRGKFLFRQIPRNFDIFDAKFLFSRFLFSLLIIFEMCSNNFVKIF